VVEKAINVFFNCHQKSLSVASKNPGLPGQGCCRRFPAASEETITPIC
jgi:hypothetical protein